jgi:DNA invertase Pin-like site-specific DNA recombinase
MSRKYAKSLNNLSIAVAYLRVSTEDQHLGPEAQRAQIQSWAESKGIRISVWKEDHGISGAAGIAGRPGLFEAINELKTLRAGWLVVAKRDRLARDLEVIIAIEKAVTAAGGQIACVDGPIIEGAAGKLIRRQFDVFAEYERGVIGERTKAALAAKRARGERFGTIPYGKKLAPDGQHQAPRRCSPKCAGCLRLEDEPYEQRVIEAARAMRERGITLRGIASLLDVEGYKTRTGTAFTHIQVGKMLGWAPRPRIEPRAPSFSREVSSRARVLEAIRRGAR